MEGVRAPSSGHGGPVVRADMPSPVAAAREAARTSIVEGLCCWGVSEETAVKQAMAMLGSEQAPRVSIVVDAERDDCVPAEDLPLLLWTCDEAIRGHAQAAGIDEVILDVSRAELDDHALVSLLKAAAPLVTARTLRVVLSAKACESREPAALKKTIEDASGALRVEIDVPVEIPAAQPVLREDKQALDAQAEQAWLAHALGPAQEPAAAPSLPWPPMPLLTAMREIRWILRLPVSIEERALLCSRYMRNAPGIGALEMSQLLVQAIADGEGSPEDKVALLGQVRRVSMQSAAQDVVKMAAVAGLSPPEVDAYLADLRTTLPGLPPERLQEKLPERWKAQRDDDKAAIGDKRSSSEAAADEEHPDRRKRCRTMGASAQRQPAPTPMPAPRTKDLRSNSPYPPEFRSKVVDMLRVHAEPGEVQRLLRAQGVNPCPTWPTILKWGRAAGLRL